MTHSKIDANLENAVRGIALGRSLLFVGAGFSHSAINKQGNNLPKGTELAAHLASITGEDPDTALDVISDMFIEDRSEDELLA